MVKEKGGLFSIFFNSDFTLITIYFLLAIACISIYPSVKIPYFLFLFVMFYFSKRDYLYFLLLFVIMQGPGYFFNKYERVRIYFYFNCVI